MLQLLDMIAEKRLVFLLAVAICWGAGPYTATRLAAVGLLLVAVAWRVTCRGSKGICGPVAATEDEKGPSLHTLPRAAETGIWEGVQ